MRLWVVNLMIDLAPNLVRKGTHLNLDCGLNLAFRMYYIMHTGIITRINLDLKAEALEILP